MKPGVIENIIKLISVSLLSGLIDITFLKITTSALLLINVGRLTNLGIHFLWLRRFNVLKWSTEVSKQMRFWMSEFGIPMCWNGSEKKIIFCNDMEFNIHESFPNAHLAIMNIYPQPFKMKLLLKATVLINIVT